MLTILPSVWSLTPPLWFSNHVHNRVYRYGFVLRTILPKLELLMFLNSSKMETLATFETFATRDTFMSDGSNHLSSTNYVETSR